MTTQPVQMSFSGETYTDALLWGGWHWNDPNAAPGAPTQINYFLDTYGTRSWSAAEANAFDRALETWSSVANITFVQVGSAASAQLIERLTSNARLPGALGEHGTPESAALGPEYDGSLLLGDSGQAYGYFNYQAFSPGSFASGGYDLITLIHELGHGLGLAHPHDDGGGSLLFPGVGYDNAADLGSNNLNQGVYTVMSYNDGWASGQNPAGRGLTRFGFEAGPMAFDIAAIQYLYGANTSAHNGDDVYVLPSANVEGTSWSCLWDTGGTDEIAYTGRSNVQIDLRAATLDNSPTGGGVLSYATGIFGGFTVAHGVMIENASGGLGHDTLTGNGSANVLAGGAGNDLLRGGGGDTFDGGSGTDTASYILSAGFVAVDLALGVGTSGAAAGDVFVIDAVTGRSNVENIVGSYFDDFITGNSSTNRLWGDAGDDVIEGGDGRDLLYGGSNTAIGDTVSYEHASAGVRINLAVTKLQRTGGGGVDTLSGFENAVGSAFNDVLSGTAVSNLLNGGDGADILSGGLGHDTLIGGAGGDYFMFRTAASATNIDEVDDFETGIDHIYIDDAIFTRAGHRGFLDTARFVTGAMALDADDRILYDSTTGDLIYDANGSAAGGTRVFAHLDIGLSLSSADIYIF